MATRAFPRHAVVAGVVAAAAAASGVARAEAAPMRLSYEAPAGCPDAVAFTADVRARAPGANALDGRRVEVAVRATPTTSPGPTQFEGRVAIGDENGVTPSRAVRGDTCAEVVRALALAVAMSIDPAEDVAPNAAAAAPTPTPAAPAGPAVDHPAPPTGGGVPVHVSAGLKGGTETAVGPAVAPSAGIYVDVAAKRASVRLAATRAVGPVVERGAGSARFARTAVTLDGCPLRWSLTPTFALVPCATFETGSLTADGQSTVDPESNARLWMAAGLAGRLVWEPLGPIVVELEGRLMGSLTRDRFFFRPAESVFQAPIVAFSAALTAGVRFW